MREYHSMDPTRTPPLRTELDDLVHNTLSSCTTCKECDETAREALSLTATLMVLL